MVSDNVETDASAVNARTSEDMDAVADRLDSALDRIARRLDAVKPHRAGELAARVDGLIGRLRDVLASPPGPGQI